MQSIFAETLVKSKDEFLQKYLADNNFVRYEVFAAFSIVIIIPLLGFIIYNTV